MGFNLCTDTLGNFGLASCKLQGFKACKYIIFIFIFSWETASNLLNRSNQWAERVLHTANLYFVGKLCIQYLLMLGHMLFVDLGYYIRDFTIFVNLGLFRHFETVTNIRTWMKSY